MNNSKSSNDPAKSTQSRSAASPERGIEAPVLAGPTASVPDTVAGDPPVPITAWYLSRPRFGTKVPAALVRRLIANYTQPGTPVVNLSTGHRTLESQSPPASLIITDWPRPPLTNSSHRNRDLSGSVDSGDRSGAREHLAACAGQLAQGGCLAVVVTTRDIPELLGVLVQAARTTGLRYLQHVVVVHQVKPRRNEPRPADASSQSLRAHTDVLVFLQPAPRPDATADIARTRTRDKGRRPRA